LDTKRKKKVTYHPDTLKIPETRYWNEYDHPEDGSEDENGYYIYMDPNASEKFLGQETAEILYAKVKSLFKKPKATRDEEQQTLLSPNPSEGSSSPTTDSDEDAVPKTVSPAKKQRQYSTSTTYGTIVNPSSRSYLPSLDAIASDASPRLLITSLSFIASTIICLIISMLAATGRKKLKGKVDAGILFGVVGSLFFALVGMVSVVTGRESLGVVRWAVVGLVFAAICVVDGVLVGWVVG
jgi:ABC-type glycerol-3-phosphate transport system permease component